MGFQCEVLKQVYPFLSNRKGHGKPKRTKSTNPRSTFHRGKNSGMAITKMLDTEEQRTLTMKLKLVRNRAIFKVTNSTHEAVTFHPKEILGVIDLRLLGYYRIKQGVLQQNLNCM